MALAGTGGYYAATNIPDSDFALNATYTRHLFAKASAVPSTVDFQVVTSIRGGFNSNFSHDEFAWNHTNSAFHRTNYHRSGGYVAAQMTAGNFAANTWHSIGATWDGTNIRSYFNGVLDGTSAGSSVPTSGSNQIALNAASNYGTSPTLPFTSGHSAELAIWDVVLTVDELLALSKGYRASRIRPNNLVFYAPAVRGKQDLVGGRTLLLGVGSETVSDHPRVFG